MIYQKQEGYTSYRFILAIKRSRLARHSIILAIIVLGFYYSDENHVYEPELRNYYTLFFCLLGLGLCYLNMYIFVPKLLFPGRSTLYWLCFSGMGAFILLNIFFCRWLFGALDQALYDKPIFIPPLISNVIIAMVILGISTAIKLFQQWLRDKEHISELVSAGLRSELEQLKNQINPHFILNMLNNVNVLTRNDPAKASLILMRLSDLLRYQLYDSAREKVLLSSEIQFIKDSLSLEMIRRDHFSYDVTSKGDFLGMQVPPLLFITFVENAIKHSHAVETDTYVLVNFEVIDDNLRFSCVNSQPLKKPERRTGGLGLKNIKRRLELLYPGCHTLSITEDTERFSIELNIAV